MKCVFVPVNSGATNCTQCDPGNYAFAGECKLGSPGRDLERNPSLDLLSVLHVQHLQFAMKYAFILSCVMQGIRAVQFALLELTLREVFDYIFLYFGAQHIVQILCSF